MRATYCRRTPSHSWRSRNSRVIHLRFLRRIRWTTTPRTNYPVSLKPRRSRGRRGFLLMRSALLFALLALPAALLRADSLSDELTRGIQFLEKRIAADPDDFLAANQLAERLLRRAAWTGSIDDLRSAEKVVVKSLKAVPEEQNPGAVALMG